MNTSKELTKLPANSDNESDTENVEMPLMKNMFVKNNKFKLCIIAVGIIFLIVATCWIIGLVVDVETTNNNTNEDEEATFSLEDLMRSNMSYNNFIDEQKLQFDAAFAVFDKNDDGYLNQTEFATYFEWKLNHSSSFQRIDVDGDNILSFSECVTWINAINSIPEVHASYLKQIGAEIKMRYGFDYNSTSLNISNEERYELFIEYATMFMYFESLDSDRNGYIRFDDYTSKCIQSEFNAIDLDQDDKIRKDEFANLIYGTNNCSWTGTLNRLFGDNYKNVMHQLAQIQITEQMVQSTNNNLILCPSKTKGIKQDETKRRLQCWDECDWEIVCDIDGCYWDYVCVYKCRF